MHPNSYYEGITVPMCIFKIVQNINLIFYSQALDSHQFIACGHLLH